MASENPYQSPRGVDTSKHQPPGRVFRPWMLFAYAIGGAVIFSAVIGLSPTPPPRQMLGDAAYYRTWAMIVFGGAVTGAVCYVCTNAVLRWISRRIDD